MLRIVKWSFVGLKRVFTLVGIAAVITVAANVDPIYHWLQSPRLEVQFLHSEFYPNKSAVIPAKININIVPHRRLHFGQYPANQLKNISVRKGDSYLPVTTEPKTPFTVRDEAVPVAIWILSDSVFQGEYRGKPIVIQILDLLGNASRIEVTGP